MDSEATTVRRRSKPLPTRAAAQALERILLSPDFDASRRSRDFLCFVVEEALAGRGKALTQGTIATRVFGRKDDFDPLLDPIVRIQAGRLRRSLERYYLLGGKADPVRLELPKGSYAPVFRRREEAEAAGGPPAPLAAEAPSVAVARTPLEWPAVLVRSFECDAASDEHRVLLREYLAAELGRPREVRVLLDSDGQAQEPSRPPTARFELRGRLRREGERIVVAARLADLVSGEQVWGEEFPAVASADQGGDAGLEEVARLVAARLGAESGILVQALMDEHRRSPVPGAYGAILQAYNFFFARDVSDLPPAIEAVRRVVAEAPENSLAWLLLARLYQVNFTFELTDLDTPIDQSIVYAGLALRLDPPSARVRSILAASLLVKGELELGRDTLEQALCRNPGSLVYQEIMGWLLALLGDWDRGIGLMRDAMARNPYHQPHVYHGLWADHLRRGDLEAAYRAALAFPDPTFFWRSLMRASSLGLLGRTRDAEAAAAELRRQKPAIEERGRVLIGYYLKPVELRERVVEGLRRAGIHLR